MKFAAKLNTLRAYCQNEQDLLHTLTRLREMGFDGVELEFGLLKNAGREAVARHLEEIGLEAASLRSPFARTDFGLEDMIEQAKQLKCKNVGVGTMTMEYFERGPQMLALYFEKLEAASRRLKEEGLQPLYSLRDHEFLRRMDGRWVFDRIAEQAEALDLQFETDVLCLSRAAVEPYIFERLAGRMPLCRLSDQKIRENEMYLFLPLREECPLGEGLLDLPLWSEAAAHAGAEWLVLGQELCDRDPFECLRISLEEAKKLA